MRPWLLYTLSQSISSCLVGLITIPIRSQAQEGVSGLFKITELVNTNSRYHRCGWPLTRREAGREVAVPGMQEILRKCLHLGTPSAHGSATWKMLDSKSVGSPPLPVRTSEWWMSPRLLVPALGAGSSQACRVL